MSDPWTSVPDTGDAPDADDHVEGVCMNKRDPDQVVRDFTGFAGESIDEWASVTSAIRHLPARQQSTVSRDAFVRVAVAWEVFRSDWHIAALAKDTSTLADTLDDEIRRRLRNAPSLKSVVPHLRLDIPKHVPLATARALIDPDGVNVDLSTKGAVGGGATTWVRRASDHLSPAWAERVASLSLADLRFSAYVESLRDCAAHESPKAVESLRGAHLALSSRDRAALGAAVPTPPRSIARYVHAAVGPSRRVETFHARLVEVAQRLLLRPEVPGGEADHE